MLQLDLLLLFSGDVHQIPLYGWESSNGLHWEVDYIQATKWC